jgi:hypothetical protein
MKRFRLLIAAAVFGLVTTACSSDLVGPNPTEPSFDEVTPPTSIPGPNGQGTFGSGG